MSSRIDSIPKEQLAWLSPWYKPGVIHIIRKNLLGLFDPSPSLLILLLLTEADYLGRHLENPFLPTICLCSLWITTKLEELYTCLIQPHMTIERISRWDYDIKTSHLANIMWNCSFSLPFDKFDKDAFWQVWQGWQKWFARYPHKICQELAQDSPRMHLGII